MPEVMFNGPDGRIEARFHKSALKNAPCALVLHPHPLHGGTMNNKVVYNTYKAFVRSGFSVLRINFRGAGRSQGTFDNGVGELTDAATALDWLQLQNPDNSNFWIAGFSFGAWISLQLLMRRPEIQGFIAISPPANQYDFSFLSPCPSSGLIIQGDEDSIVTESSVADLADKLSRQRGSDISYHVVPGADHFFRDKIDNLSQTMEDYIKLKLTQAKPRRVKPDRRRRQNVDDS